MLLCMKRAEVAACGGCFGDGAGGGTQPHRHGAGGGGEAGAGVRFFAAIATKKQLVLGSGLSLCGFLRMAVCRLRGLWRRSAHGGVFGYGRWGVFLAHHTGQVAAAGVFGILERNLENFAFFIVSC